jgi:ligand-binding SRPBCC domain-containing protein
MRERRLTLECLVPRPHAEVFAFFADARNLEALTPPWLRFRILTEQPIAMGEGTLIDYRIALRGLPMRWRSRIAAWEPPHRFVDEQLRGPYRLWVHEHRFTAHPLGTLVRDTVRYAIAGGPFEPWIHRWLVRPDLRRIFAFRSATLSRLLGCDAATTAISPCPDPVFS